MPKPPQTVSKRKIRTMEELSEAINVSRPTLSRYFQDTSSVRDSTGEKIRAGLEGLDYVPNFFATRMNRKSSGLIGLVVPYFNDLFFTSLLGSIEIAALEAGYTIITQSSHGDATLEAHAVEKLLSMNVDGVIIAPLGQTSHTERLQRLNAELPLIFVDSRLPETAPNVGYVGTDNDHSIGLMVDYLCRTGPAPLFLEAPATNSNSTERENAYRRQMQSLGHTPELIQSALPSDTWNFEAYAHDVMDAHFARGHHTDATILCANDRLAIGVIRAANRYGLFQRPEPELRSFRVAGHDDYPLSSFMTPTLTTIAQDTRTIGRTVVTQLVEHIHSGTRPIAMHVCQGKLILRESA